MKKRCYDRHHPGKPAQTAFIGLKIDEATAEKLQEVADREGKSMSLIVKELIRNYLAKEN